MKSIAEIRTAAGLLPPKVSQVDEPGTHAGPQRSTLMLVEAVHASQWGNVALQGASAEHTAALLDTARGYAAQAGFDPEQLHSFKDAPPGSRVYYDHAVNAEQRVRIKGGNA